MSRHFIRLGGRWVHYRRWGEGPAVIAIHGSPQSARAVEAVGLAIAARGFCAIAPDTPGNGLSTPLPGEPTSADYAAALAKFAGALGLGRVGLYGYHTGANTAAAFAALYPARVTAVVFNGLSCWTQQERETLQATYLPRFIPSWDGAHMAWAWARLEEYTVFFPWNQPTQANRMRYDIAPLEAMQTNAVDLLDSGDGYCAPYASAFSFRTEEWLHRITTPFLLAAAENDPLRPHLNRAPLNERKAELFSDAPSLIAAAADFLMDHPGDAAASPPQSGVDADGISRGFTGLPGGTIAWRGSLAGSGRPLVLLHQAGGSSRVFDEAIGGLAGRRPVLAFDLPGHGESTEGWGSGAASVLNYAEIIGHVATVIGLDRPAVAGEGLGAAIGRAMLAGESAIAAGTFDSPGVRSPEPGAPGGAPAPSLAPEWDGSHLLRAFRIARWERLFHPWYRRDRAHAVPQGNLDPADIQSRALDLVKARERWSVGLFAEARFNASGVAEATPIDRADIAAFAAVHRG